MTSFVDRLPILLMSWAEQWVLSRVFLRPRTGLRRLAFPGACSGVSCQDQWYCAENPRQQGRS